MLFIIISRFSSELSHVHRLFYSAFYSGSSVFEAFPRFERSPKLFVMSLHLLHLLPSLQSLMYLGSNLKSTFVPTPLLLRVFINCVGNIYLFSHSITCKNTHNIICCLYFTNTTCYRINSSSTAPLFNWDAVTNNKSLSTAKLRNSSDTYLSLINKSPPLMGHHQIQIVNK